MKGILNFFKFHRYLQFILQLDLYFYANLSVKSAYILTEFYCLLQKFF